MALDLTELTKALIEVPRLADVTLQPCDVKTQALPAPHRRPRSLPLGSQAVYAFFLGAHCLKVGKAGPKTQARFTSQHYGESAPSTLAKSILRERSRVAALLAADRRVEIERLNPDSIGDWIEANTSRVHIFTPATADSFLLGLVESFAQCRFRPIFEGKAQ